MALDPSMLPPDVAAQQTQQQPDPMGAFGGGQDRGPPPPQQDAQPPQGGPPQGPGGIPPMPQRPTNVVTIDQVMKLMRDDRMRSFRIDIETDSTVQADENEYKQRMGEFMTAIGTFVEKVMPAMEVHPELGPFLGEALLTVVRGYRVGRQLEGAIEDAVATMEEKAEAGGGPPPNPEMVKAQQDAASKQAEIAANERMEQQRVQAENARHQAQLQFEDQKHQREIAAKQQTEAIKLAAEREKGQTELAIKQSELALKEAEHHHRTLMEGQRFAFDQQSAQDRLAFDREGREAELAFNREGREAEAAREAAASVTEAPAPAPAPAEAEQAEKPDRHAEALMAIAAAMTRPKTIVRGPDGTAIGVE